MRKSGGMEGRNARAEHRPEKAKSLWIAVPPDIHQAIVERAKAEGWTRSEFIRRALVNELNDVRRRRIVRLIERHGFYETGMVG